ncbi:Retrovirus-related Pol polyprotein from transposon TNT 1-94 [Gossypium australe]|uniref:Retrovirus-related Pol polyprotein from transposon TNT 1-94 n=1 Tax=Gossypium australe TaxID=47621 RepID=A0A5B6VMG0_9ROSI|nr:Retrovirus-related Pol polyprotein from transposon TNT 1-94 [Gossypium australe]
MFTVSCPTTSRNGKDWLVDSGCTSHMTSDANIFKNIDRSFNSKIKLLGNGYFVLFNNNRCLIFYPSGCKLILVVMFDKSFAANWNLATSVANVSSLDEKKSGIGE